MTSQPRRQTIAMHILPNMSRSKGSNCQLIEYNRNIFLKNWYTNYGGETSPKPFSKKTKSSIYLDQ